MHLFLKVEVHLAAFGVGEHALVVIDAHPVDGEFPHELAHILARTLFVTI